MKHIIITTIAAVLLVGCGESQQESPSPETQPAEPVAKATQPEPPTAEAPAISIIDAARDGNIKSVKQHLAAGTHVDTINSFENTALHRAAEFGRKEVVELLIAKGANVNARGFLGITPLDRAIGYKPTETHPELADLLRKHGGKTKKELEAAGK
jgi:ankyrin repeat protein